MDEQGTTPGSPGASPMAEDTAPEPLLSIGEVVERLHADYPDISISSLRFLEREGLIAPRRTRGGHRLFSAHDIERVRHIKEMQRRRFSLAEISLRLGTDEGSTAQDDLSQHYLTLILTGQRTQALDLVQHAVATGMPVADVYQHIITPAMTHVGALWQQNTITVADEHLATAISRDAMAVLREQIVPAPPRGLRAVAAGAQGELHELGLKMTADLFEGAGWEVAYLGPNTPVDSLLAYMARWKPQLLLLSIGSVASLLATADVIAAVRAQAAHLGPVIVGVGGPGLLGGAQTWERLGADFWAETAGQAVARANALMAGAPHGEA